MAQAGTRRGKLYSAPQPSTNWPTTLRARRGDTWTGVDVIVPIGQRRHRAVHSCPARKRFYDTMEASAMAQAGTRRGKLYSAPQPCTNWPTTLRSRRGDTWTGLDVIVPIGQRRHRELSCKEKVLWYNGASAMAQAGTRRGKPYSAPQPCTNWPTTLRSRRGDTWTGVDVIVPIGQCVSNYLVDTWFSTKALDSTRWGVCIVIRITHTFMQRRSFSERSVGDGGFNLTCFQMVALPNGVIQMPSPKTKFVRVLALGAIDWTYTTTWWNLIYFTM